MPRPTAEPVRPPPPALPGLQYRRAPEPIRATRMPTFRPMPRCSTPSTAAIWRRRGMRWCAAPTSSPATCWG
ncbi:hypothetical protein ACFQU2_38590 [Siccirubricoccus deserti]